MQAWNVYLEGEYIDADLIDTVHYNATLDEEYVLSSLINHDGFDACITIEKA